MNIKTVGKTLEKPLSERVKELENANQLLVRSIEGLFNMLKEISASNQELMKLREGVLEILGEEQVVTARNTRMVRRMQESVKKSLEAGTLALANEVGDDTFIVGVERKMDTKEILPPGRIQILFNMVQMDEDKELLRGKVVGDVITNEDTNSELLITEIYGVVQVLPKNEIEHELMTDELLRDAKDTQPVFNPEEFAEDASNE